MPRQRKVFRKMCKKRVRALLNCRHTNNFGNGTEVTSEETTCSELANSSSSSSRQKITSVNIMETGDDCKNNTGYRMIDIELLSSAVKLACVCKKCGSENLELFDDGNRVGVVCNVHILCKDCDADTSFKTSKSTKWYYEANVRFLYGLRCIGVGREGGNLLCGMMNMPAPCARFSTANTELEKALYEVCEENLSAATAEAVRENDPLDDEDGNHVKTDLVVSCDGTFMKRGHTSLYGISSVISVDVGKVLDVQVMSKYCQSCPITRNRTTEDLLKNHSCRMNHSGSSGSMEGAGMKVIFNRSVSKHGVRYVKYLGDGDSSAFKVVSDSKPYGEECIIEKLECVGHVQKRMGSRLRKIVDDMKGKKLEDGKGLSGKNRLTKKMIDTLQVYYGKSIRDNLSSVEDMRRAVWATYFHMLSTDEHPTHNLCSISWCRYKQAQRDGIPYTHKASLPTSILNVIKPTFRFLSNPELLKKCVHGKTQNPNESLNALIWKRCPKTTFCSSKVVKIAVYDAVIVFNGGSSERIKVLQKMGFKPGVFTRDILMAIDTQRILAADKSIEDLAKQTRLKRRSQKRSLEGNEDNDYKSGGF